MVAGREGEARQMLPAVAYTAPHVLAWELRHLYAGSWACLGRVGDLFADDATTQRALTVGDVSCLVTRDRDTIRMFANTCRHRGHELLADDDAADRRAI